MMRGLKILSLFIALLLLPSCGSMSDEKDVKFGIVPRKYSKSSPLLLKAEDGKTYLLGGHFIKASYRDSERVKVTGDITDTGRNYLEFIDYTVEPVETSQEETSNGS